jgi:hypothetical protein
MSLAKINSLRASIADKKAERDAVESSRVSHDELRDALEAQVARAADAAKGAAWRIGVASYEGGVLSARMDGNGRADMLPAMVTLFGPDVVLQHLERHILAVPNGLTAAQRTAQIEAIDAELDKLERAEEAAVRALERTGMEVARRPDASPAAVLADL